MSGKKQCDVCGLYKTSDTMRILMIDNNTNPRNPNRYTVHSICRPCDEVLSIHITNEMVQQFFCSNEKVNLWTNFPLDREIMRHHEFVRKWAKYI